MYKDHIKNYAVWKSKLGELITPHSVKWLDMQEPYSADFGPIAFENAYQENQHMTYQGSLLATYKLAEFIKTQPEIKLPNRKAELLWYNTFYGEEGFFENNSPSTTDKNNRIISQDKKFSNVQLSQVLMVDVPQKPNVKNLIAKVDRALFKSVDPKTTELILTLQYMENNQMKSFQIALNYDYLHTPTEFALFSKAINFVDIKDVIEATVVRITN